MATRTLYPTIAPSLDLNFAGSKTLDPRITFNRASAATYYDGKTVAKAEENSLLRSQEFSNTWWYVGRGSVTKSATTAPDGSAGAELLTATSTGTFATTYRAGVTYAGGIQYTLSVYAKAESGQHLILVLAETGLVGRANFDLVSGTVGTTSADTTARITDAGGGWWRCSVTATPPTNSNATIIIGVGDSNSTLSVTLGKAIYIWGAQLEQRSQVTAYTPTTTQPITNYIPVLQTAPAGVPRFDHNPVTGESLGLLVEEQRTNLLNWSEQFDHAIWGKSALVLQPNVSVAPDGTLSAEKVSADTTNANHLISRYYASSSGTYTASIYVKSAGVSRLRLYLNDAVTGDSYVTVDLASESIVASGANGSWTSGSSSLTKLSSGWFRISVSGTQGAGTQVAMILILQSNAGQSPFSGDGYSGIYIWGAQLEAGTFPTSYIKTEASQVTRAADFAYMIGTNFSSWYSQDEGSLFTESISNSISPFDSYVASIQGSNVDNSIRLGQSANGVARRFNIRVNATNILALDITPSSVARVPYKQAAGYKIGDCAVASNGSNVLTLAPGNLPYSLDRLHIGVASHSITVKKLAYYPKRLTNAQLQALTV